jgi:CheY-like chemotaxis protein
MQTLSVLVCEYKPINQTVISRILQHYGYCVLMTSSAEEALGVFWNDPHNFDLLLIDIPVPRQVVWEDNKVVVRVPEISFEWLERIRQARPNLPVLLISGSLGEAFIPPANAHHLAKPFTAQELFTAMKDVMVASSFPTRMAA